MAAATSMSSAPRSFAPGMPVSCWIRNFESVVRPRYMVRLLRSSASGLRVRRSKRGLEHAAGADVGRRDGAELLGREAPLAIGEQPARGRRLTAEELSSIAPSDIRAS